MTLHAPDLLPDRADGNHDHTLFGHLRRHGASLAAVIAALGDPFDTHVVKLARAELDAPEPDAAAVAGRLKVVLEALECASAGSLAARAGHYDGPDLPAAVRWHGARLTDLLRG